MASLKLVFFGLFPLAALAASDLADDAVCGDCSPERAEAFVQHKRSRGGAGGKDKSHVARKGSHCDGENLRNHCPRSGGTYLDYMKKPAAVLDKYKPRMGKGDDLLEELRISDPESWEEFTEARKSFDALRYVDARKVMAFKETWLPEDSTMLKKMANLKDAWVPGKFDHEKFKESLPSVSILEELLEAGDMAIVGAGSSLTRKGDDIDGHPTVVRFNNHIGSELLQKDTGEKMTVHVVNGLVDFNPEKGVVHMDLESTFPGSSMCKRWHNQKRRTAPLQKDQVTLLFRPTAVCGLPESMASFTRGFLFYWLVGRLAPHSDNYGMGLRDGLTHRVHDSSMVNERFLEFEHALYNAADRLEARQAAEKKAADEAKAAKAAAKAAEEAKAVALQQVDNTTAAAAVTTKADAPAPTTAAAEKAKTDAATTAASPAATTAAAAAATTAAATTAAAAEKAATTAAASETTAGVVKTTAAPAAVTTPATEAATEAPKEMKDDDAPAKESNDTAEEDEETEDEPESAEDEESEEEEEEEEDEEEEEEEEEETTTRKPTKKKHTKHHHKSGASHSSAFTSAALIAAATWMLHM